MLRTSIVAAVLAFSSAALAQNLLSQIPTCAQTCFGSNLGSCGPLDIACICGNSAVIDKVSCCVFSTCSQADITATTAFATNLCSLQGVQVNTSPNCSANSASASAASTSAASAASSASSVLASVSASRSASASASATATRSVASVSTSAVATATGAAAPLQQAGAGALGLAVAGLLAVL